MSLSPEKPTKSLARMVLIAATAVVALLIALHFLLQYLNWEVYYQQNGQVYELANRFDLDDEVSVPTWFSQILMLLIGSAALLAAYVQTKKEARRLWLMIGVLGIGFCIDEAAGLHEFALQTLHVTFFKDAKPTESDNAWLLVLPFILLIGGWLLWRMVQVVPKRTIGIIALSGTIFLTGAIGIDLLTSLTERESFLHQGILVGLEEGLELLATAVVLYAVVDFLEKHHQPQLAHIADGFRRAKANSSH